MKIQSLEKIGIADISKEVLRLCYLSDLDGISDRALVWPNIGKTWVICIHGHGSHEDQLYVRSDIKTWVEQFRNYNFGILTPNLRDNAWMSPDAVTDMHDLINFLRDRYDAEKFIFFSGSMGGTSNLIYSLLHPEDINVAVALGAVSDLSSYYFWCKQKKEVNILKEIAEAISSSYGGNPKELPGIFEKHSVINNCDKLKVPLFLAHGQADTTMPVEQSRNLAEKLKGRANFCYHEIPDGDHDAPIYDRDALDWIMTFL